jgi:quinol monooxygenase YgiN
MSAPLGVLATVVVREGRTADFEALARQIWEATHAHETGVQRYEYSRAEADRTYYVSMLFDDYEAFLVHQASPHHTDLAGQMRDIYERIDLQFTQPVQGGFGVPEPRTPRGVSISEELQAKYRDRYPEPHPSWWV